MKERPILMSGPMVRAIIEGRKTQTRRVGKCQNDDATELGVAYDQHATKGTVAVATYRAFPGGGSARWGLCECPYGIPGDRLWVKETFQYTDESLNFDPGWVYRATDPDWDNLEGWAWKPSIFMPRTASRITLEIISVRVERVQDITAADAIAEGIGVDGGQMRETPNFRELWDSLNAKRSNGIYAWSKNPWVWKIEFPPFSRSLNQGANA